MKYLELQEQKNVLEYGFLDKNGKPVLDKDGKEVTITFDVEDIDLIERYSRCANKLIEIDRKFKTKIKLVDKKTDAKTNGFLTKNDIEKQKLLKEYYRESTEAFELFIGKGGVKKMLNGRNPYWNMFNDFVETLKPVMNDIKEQSQKMIKDIKNKYSDSTNEGFLND